MDTSENLKVLVSLVNDGPDAVNVLNHPQGPLSKLPTNTFSITDSKDASIEPQFMGIRLKYSPEKAAKAGDYTTLAPGEVLTMEHYRT
jgi:peptidyl-Lys metalloendopeptidase